MANQGLQFHFWRDGSHNSNGLENHEVLNWQVRTGFLKHFAVPFALMLIGRMSCSYSLKTWTLHSRGLRANHEITASFIACAPFVCAAGRALLPHPRGKIWDDSGKSLPGVWHYYYSQTPCRPLLQVPLGPRKLYGRFFEMVKSTGVDWMNECLL